MQRKEFIWDTSLVAFLTGTSAASWQPFGCNKYALCSIGLTVSGSSSQSSKVTSRNTGALQSLTTSGMAPEAVCHSDAGNSGKPGV